MESSKALRTGVEQAPNLEIVNPLHKNADAFKDVPRSYSNFSLIIASQIPSSSSAGMQAQALAAQPIQAQRIAQGCFLQDKIQARGNGVATP
jgi:hypothetical protein